MKKKLLSISVGIALSFISLIPVQAGSNWANVGVTLNTNGGGNYTYLLDIGGNYSVTTNLLSNTTFSGHDFGNFVIGTNTLVLDGGIGAGAAWSGDYFTTSSFVIYYRAYSTTGSAGSWSSFVLNNQTTYSGSNAEYNATGAAIDVLGLVGNTPGTYYLEIVMSKLQYWNSGSSNYTSMIPGGQETPYSSSTAGYKATFTIPLGTGIATVPNDFALSVANKTISARFSGAASIQLLTISGQLIENRVANGNFQKSVQQGIYIVKVNGKSYKVVVP